jgi:hypothetical protein
VASGQRKSQSIGVIGFNKRLAADDTGGQQQPGGIDELAPSD